MNHKEHSIMRTTYLPIILFVLTLSISSCEDVSDMAVNKVASPVLLDVKTSGTTEVTAFFYELDKTGILDNAVGIDSIPVAGLAIEVFAASSSIGSFTTDADGSFKITYTGTKPSEYAGVHKGIAFRIKK
jgi:hypothetical protein